VVNEIHASQQRMGEACVAANAIRSLARVKAIVSLHEMHNPRLHLSEEIHAAIWELYIDVKLCKTSTQEINLPYRSGAMDKGLSLPSPMLHPTLRLPIQLSFPATGMHRRR
jgi:hypothetical protein